MDLGMSSGMCSGTLIFWDPISQSWRTGGVLGGGSHLEAPILPGLAPNRGTGRAGPAPSLFPLLPKFPNFPGICEFHFNCSGFSPFPHNFSCQSFVPGGDFYREAPLPVAFPGLPLLCGPKKKKKKIGTRTFPWRVWGKTGNFSFGDTVGGSQLAGGGRVPVPVRVPSPGQVTRLMSSR